MAFPVLASRCSLAAVWRAAAQPRSLFLALGAWFGLGLGGCPPAPPVGGPAPASPGETSVPAVAGDAETGTTNNYAEETADTPEETVPEVVSFARDVVPVFQTHCAICHAPGATADRAGISLRLTAREAYESLVNQTSSQLPQWKRVVPGSVEQSLLYYKISAAEPPVGNRMPLACAPLTEIQVQSIRRWIEQGALNN